MTDTDTDTLTEPPDVAGDIAAAIAQVATVLDNLRSLAAVSPLAAVNPDGSPGLVAPGELIESAWGNAVSNSFKRVSPTLLQFAPASPAAYTSTSMGNWYVVGNITVPAWATAVVLDVKLNSLQAVGAAAVAYTRVTLATVASSAFIAEISAANLRIDHALSAQYTGLTPGASLQVVMQAQMSAGQIRMNTDSRTSVIAHWRPT